MSSIFDEQAKKFLANFAIVSVTSAIAKTITAPIDRIKLILQNQDSALAILKGERKRYSGIINCLVRLPKEQGFRSLWRGNGTNILRYFPTQALNFAFNDFYKTLFRKTIGDDSLLAKFVSGGLAGTCAITIMFPLEFCQTRIAVDMGNDSFRSKDSKASVQREFYGLGDCVRKISKADGFKGLYGGYSVAVVGITLYRALYFGLFDSFKQMLAIQQGKVAKDAPKPHIIIGLLLAQCVTCISGICTYPLDTVARRLMLDKGRPKNLRLFTGPWNAFRLMYKHEGVITFYRGAFTNCIRGLSGALVLVFYDEVLHYTKWKEWLSPCDNC